MGDTAHWLPLADASSDTMIRPNVVYPDTPFPEGSAMHEVRLEAFADAMQILQHWGAKVVL